MPCLILDPKVKSLCLVSLFIGCEEGVNIVEEYHKWTLYPMLLKCYHLHRMAKSKVECANQTRDAKFDLSSF